MEARHDPTSCDSGLTMDQLRLFVSLRSLHEGKSDPAALRTVHDELACLESRLAGAGVMPEPFRLTQEDLDNLHMLKVRQDLQAEGHIIRLGPIRWLYNLFRRLLFGTQRRYNESVTYLVRRLYATALLTRYYQLRSLDLEERVRAVESRLAAFENRLPPSEKSS